MADLLAEVGDLSTFLGEDIEPDVEQLLLELATAGVQVSAGQQIVEVVDDTVELIGGRDKWLPLPQRPVSAVASVEIDGSVVTDYTLFGSRLWRRQGWAPTYKPSTVKIVYTHGYPAGDQGLQLARQATLMTAAQMRANPTGATGFGIDDYREQYSHAADRIAGEVPRSLGNALRQRYGVGVWTLALG